MANVVLEGQSQGEIDHTYALTSYDLSVSGDRPVSVKYGPQGPIGSARGQLKPSGSLKFAVPKTGLEFDWFKLLNKAEGFTFSFPIGAERHQLYGAQVNKMDFSNNPETGETTWSVSFTATEWIRIK